MKLLLDEDLVEAVAVLCVSGQRKGAPALQVRRFHSEREKLYSILDADERSAAFFQLHLEWFREWGIEQLLRTHIKRFPLLEESLDGLAFRKARGRNEESAELFVSAERGRHAVVAMRAEQFGRDDVLGRFLNHELMHINDMLDPVFGYSPRIAVVPGLRSHERLVRDRYRLLWDVTIDGRLTQRGLPVEVARDDRLREFIRAFAFWPDEQCRETFDSLWLDLYPTHARLMQLASDPRNLEASQQTLPGAPCPLCGFATFDWANLSAAPQNAVEIIHAEFPRWTEKEGACSRCVEIYSTLRVRDQTGDPFLV